MNMEVGSALKAEGETERTKPRAKDLLLECAIKEFAEKGYAGASMNEIAAGAGANKQAPYHYFKNKEGLYLAVLENVLVRTRASDPELDFSGMEPFAALTAFIDHMLNTSLADPSYQRLLIDANWYGSRYIGQIHNTAVTTSRRIPLLDQILKRGSDTGVFREGLDPTEVYISILGILSVRATNAHSLSHTLGIDLVSEDGRARSRQSAIEMILFGIRTK